MSATENADSRAVNGSQSLVASIEARQAIVGVMGLGYVGLPLASTFHRAGFKTIGFDTDSEIVKDLNAGRSYLEHLPDSEALFRSLADSDMFSATSDMGRLKEVDVAIICVPTPLGPSMEPDLHYVEECTRRIAENFKHGQLIVLESTTYPGTTRERLLPIISNTPAAPVLGKDVFLAFSPEREDPGNKSHQMKSIPKLVGGLDDASTEAACALYKAAFERVYRVSRAEVAEAAKLLENIYRAVNIALVNELKMLLHKMSIDVWEVLDAAETKPFGFHRFNPGPGWGGHCIPVDPFYLTWKARSLGMSSHFIEHAGEINIQMPSYVVSHIQRALNADRKPLNGSNILILGIAYKPNIGDTRETPALEIWRLLHEQQGKVSYFDPLVPKIKGHLKPDLQFLHGSEGISEAAIAGRVAESDAIVVVTPHDCFLAPTLGKRAPDGSVKEVSKLGAALKEFLGPIIDTRNWIPPEWGRRVFKA